MRVITGLARKKRRPRGLNTPTGEKVKEACSRPRSSCWRRRRARLLRRFRTAWIEGLSRGRAGRFCGQGRTPAHKGQHKSCVLPQGRRSHDAWSIFRAVGGRLPFWTALRRRKFRRFALVRADEGGGIVFCETTKHIDLPEEAGELRLVKEYRYGRTKVLKYCRGGEAQG